MNELVVILAKLPFSASVPHPPITDCCTALQRLVKLSLDLDPETLLTNVETVMNAVQRLLKFSWSVEADDVRRNLETVLCTANSL